MASVALAPNLDRPAQTVRLRAGVIAFTIALSFSLGFAHVRLDRPLRAVLFVPFFIAAWGIAQGLTGTDPLLAARGLRDVGEGREQIADAGELARVRRTARLVNRIALAVAAALTGLIVLTAE
jgi:hypothetical protein